jgi:uncharacterized protein YutE (UPF0331/DUF86 family)
MNILAEQNVISKDLITSTIELRKIRNQAAHNYNFHMTIDLVMKYKAAVNSIINEIKNSIPAA